MHREHGNRRNSRPMTAFQFRIDLNPVVHEVSGRFSTAC